MSEWSGLTGEINTRLSWTHASLLKNVLTLPGSQYNELAGAANPPASALPKDKGTLDVTYTNNGLSINVEERYYSPLRQSTNPTLLFNIPNLPSYFQTDLDVEYDFTTMQVPFTAFVNVNNLFDRDPDVLQSPGYTGSPGMNYPTVSYEDILGRYFTVGVKFRM